MIASVMLSVMLKMFLDYTVHKQIIVCVDVCLCRIALPVQAYTTLSYRGMEQKNTLLFDLLTGRGQA